MDVQALLAHLEDLYARKELAQADYELARDAILTPAQHAQLADLEEQTAEEMEEINDTIKAAEERVRQAVAEHGQTVSGQRWQAVYRKPTVKWDGKGLEQYFKANDPDALRRFCSEGAPSVSLRFIKREQ